MNSLSYLKLLNIYKEPTGHGIITFECYTNMIVQPEPNTYEIEIVDSDGIVMIRPVDIYEEKPARLNSPYSNFNQYAILLLVGDYGSPYGPYLYNEQIKARIVATMHNGKKVYSNYLKPEYFIYKELTSESDIDASS